MIEFMSDRDLMRFNKLGGALCNTVRSNAKLYDRWVTGKSAKLLQCTTTYTAKELHYLFHSDKPAQFWQLETGRKAGKRPPLQPIQDWIKRRGIASDDKKVKQIAYAIATDIAKQGTRQVQSKYGRKKNLKTDEIFTKPFQKFQKQVDLFVNKYSQEVIKRAIKETDKLLK